MQVNVIAQTKVKELPIQFGETFLLSSNKRAVVRSKDECLKIEIINFIEEWGYDASPEVENRNYYSDVQYTLRILVKDIEKMYSFYSSDIKYKHKFSLDLENYKILILSDKYTNTSASIKMKINRID
ncbi:hypothetical protein PG911_10675 [Tenacibaculum ovolyticum]|uniref:hypothetical protein n=1 Tax=Tenacibaculum ovolyticum TaxID=104270 RepID=UPI0022F3A8FF|nr:hypothetical protein [Tenacibaculum ovolyticum]WBX75121.1 hypothetical protein PG911_10675 [Tenacibaculum ovolyticum]